MAERAGNHESSVVEGVPFFGWGDTAHADLVSVDVDVFAVSALPDFVAELDALRRSIEVAQAKALSRLHSSGYTTRVVGHVTATWMSNRLSRPRIECAHRVKAATAMTSSFPVLGAAIETGEFTLEHLEAVLRLGNPRVAAALVEAQEQLIAIAGNTTFTEFERHLRSLVNLLDQDGPHDPNEERRRSKLSILRTPDGILINGELVGTLAATVVDALNAIADRKFRERLDREDTVVSRQQLLAEALVDLCRSRETPAHGPVIEMTVVVTDTEPGRGETTGGVPVEGDSFDMCACDPILRVVTLNQEGEPLNVGRARRLATDTQRRATKIRDGGCVFPGCDMPVDWTELHHVQHWRHGGTTDLDNLACLCRRHHGVVHSSGWSMTRNRDGTFEFTSPTGRTLHSKPAKKRLFIRVA